MEDGPDYDYEGDQADYYSGQGDGQGRDREDDRDGQNNFGYDMEGNRVELQPGEKIQGNYAYKQGEGKRWIGPKELDPEYVWDQPSKEILAELIGLESGSIQSEAEKQALKMGDMLGTATHAITKSRRGVAPGAAFGTAAQQTGLISNVSRTAAADIQRKVSAAATVDKRNLKASKEAEKRGISMQYNQMRQQAELAAKSASAGLFGSFMGFLGSIGAGLIAAFSDERVKTNIDRVGGKADLMDFLNSLDVATYDKHIFGHHRHETGIMAQSAERSKVGRQFVKEVKGFKSIDANAATGPILASLKLLHDRLDELEKPKKKRGKK